MVCVTSTSLSLAKGSHVAILKLKGQEKYNSTIRLRAENIWIALVTIIVLLHTNDNLNLMPPSHYLANCVSYILSYIYCIPLRCQALCLPVWMMACSSSSGWGRDRIGTWWLDWLRNFNQRYESVVFQQSIWTLFWYVTAYRKMLTFTEHLLCSGPGDPKMSRL